MARWFSNFKAGRRHWKSGSFYVIAAIIVFAAIVFLLFRDRSSGPQQAAAGDVPHEVASDAGQSAPTTPVEAAEQASSPTSQPAPAPGTSEAENQEAEPTPSPVEAVAQGTSEAETAIAEAVARLRSRPNEVIAARNRLNEILQMPLTPTQRQTVKDEMAKLANKWLFGPAFFAGDTLCDTYSVKRGDLLQIIGRRHKVPYEILMQINNIPRPQALQAGGAMKVVQGPFHAKVYRSTFTLDLYLQDMYVRSFTVGLGKPGYETPTGLWRVKEGGKLVKPRWTDPDSGRVYTASDPDYPLGSRWIALDGVSGDALGRTGFAIHGTKDPEQIGTAGSRGCIRMYNGDAILVYKLLFPLYSQVEVFD